MKTLDEVIKAMTICKNEDINRTCEGCPIPDTEMCINELMTDALQWLKGYKVHIELDKLRDKYGVTSQELRNTLQITCPKCHSEFVILPDANNPLTWDELKSMEGKPVWVEYNFHIRNKDFRDKSKRWCIVREFKPWHDIEIIITENGFVLSKNEQIKCWQAYRKERKNETD